MNEKSDAQKIEAAIDFLSEHIEGLTDILIQIGLGIGALETDEKGQIIQSDLLQGQYYPYAADLLPLCPARTDYHVHHCIVYSFEHITQSRAKQGMGRDVEGDGTPARNPYNIAGRMD